MTDKKLIHISRIKIRWGDMDAFGHVNNTVYFRYMEQTRIDCSIPPKAPQTTATGR